MFIYMGWIRGATNERRLDFTERQIWRIFNRLPRIWWILDELEQIAQDYDELYELLRIMTN
jgi:hypothetical protein